MCSILAYCSGQADYGKSGGNAIENDLEGTG